MNANPAPPLDLDDFRRRSEQIVRARDKARQSYEHDALAEAEAEHEYRKNKAVAFASYRNDGKGVSESEILAEGDVADHRKTRDRSHALAKSALLRIDELEANRAMLRAELQSSERMGDVPVSGTSVTFGGRA